MPFTKGHKINIGNNWNLGKKQSQGTIEKRCSKTRGKKRTKEFCERISKLQKGIPRIYARVPMSEETKKNYHWQIVEENSEAHKGEKAGGWKGGICLVNKRIRASLKYRLWRTAVYERDNFTCIMCGLKGNTQKNKNGKWIELNADHIKSFALFPKLRFVIDNGRTLCVPCHKTTETYAGRINKI